MSDFVVYPAVDIKAGRAVRLLRGEMSAETIYGEPVEMALRWQSEGAEWLHVVDLDGAVEGQPANLGAIGAILDAVSIPVQLGGGLRDLGAIGAALDAGCSRVVLGSAAVEDPVLAAQAAREHPGKIALGLDLRDGKVATRGWRDTAGDVGEALVALSGAEFACVITTDIARDGAMTGPGIESLAAVLEVSPWPVIASGGVSSASDVVAIREVVAAGRQASGVIVGRALYEGAVRLGELNC
ncbi:MAG: 1-(5-phosphoribosyl)-5-((5-phosphoribosylamino)methylideneamino)imidazole-4-carboxamide isomerase [Acidobacteria bacterium]|nr:MAG: 1-(5-phosphoribosyl)-5-((5-phosphoribosylamino)methylideneamino)imidazole-4-carboxamide isomerase [Acidobacteriota bacterium]